MKKTCQSVKHCTEGRVFKFRKDDYLVNECRQCGYRFVEITNTETHIEHVYADDYFFAGKQGYPNYLDEKDMLIRYGKSYAKILSKYTTPGSLLDIGCAAGFITNGFEQSGWKCQGLEPNEQMAEYGRKQLHMQIATGNLESFVPTTKFDMVSMIQVIGHFIDIDQSMQHVKQALTDDGFVLVESWDMKSIPATLLGKGWHEYSPPSVINWFSDKSLATLFEYYGLKLVAKGRPPKRIGVKHALSMLDEKTLPFIFKKQLFRWLEKTFGKYSVPYPAADLKWYLFKNSKPV